MVQKESKMKAVVSVTFDDCFVVHDIKVIEGEKGYFIAMPSKKTPDGEYRDIAHPINSEMRSCLENKILEVFKEEQARAPVDDGDTTTEEA
jgi:stage V sporulation protein G